MKKKKKGQIEVYQIVITVLAILGLVIALFLWAFFKDTADVSDEMCRLSVLTRGTASDKLQAFVPLKCTTKKICITQESAKECKQFLIKEYARFENLAKARQIEEISVQAMYNCWSMMGEGKLNLFNGQSPEVDEALTGFIEVKTSKPSCFICSRVSFGKDLTDEADGKEILQKVDLKRVLEKNIPGQDKTYLEYFTDKQFRAYPAEFKVNFSKFESENSLKVKPTNQIAFLFMQVIAEENALETASTKGITTGIVVGGALFMSPVGKVSNLLGASALVKGGVTLFGAGVAGILAYVQTGRNQDIAATYCGNFTGGEKNPDGMPIAKEGCSIIKPIDYYKVNEINNFCEIIEGNP